MLRSWGYSTACNWQSRMPMRNNQQRDEINWAEIIYSLPVLTSSNRIFFLGTRCDWKFIFLGRLHLQQGLGVWRSTVGGEIIFSSQRSRHLRVHVPDWLGEVAVATNEFAVAGAFAGGEDFVVEAAHGITPVVLSIDLTARNIVWRYWYVSGFNYSTKPFLLSPFGSRHIGCWTPPLTKKATSPTVLELVSSLSVWIVATNLASFTLSG